MKQQPTAKKKSEDSRDKPWFKIYEPGKGPIIDGSELRNTSSSNRRAFKEPKSRP